MITLPDRFRNDTYGSETSITPLVVINGVGNKNSILISNSKVSLDGHNFDPYLKKDLRLKTGVGYTSKQFNISNMKLECFNIKKSRKFFSDIIMERGVLNARVLYYLKTPSAKSLDDCLLAFSGYVKNIGQNESSVTIEIEDRTESIVGKIKPSRFTWARNNPTQERNLPIPIVYGEVDKCPLVFYSSPYESFQAGDQTLTNSYILSADDAYLVSVSSPKVFLEDVYLEIQQQCEIFQQESIDTIYQNASIDQFYITDNKIVMDKSVEYEGQLVQGIAGSPIAYNLCEVSLTSECYFNSSPYLLQYQSGPSGIDDYYFASIQAYEDPEGTVLQTDTANPSYLMINDHPEDDLSVFPNGFPHAEWFWGQNVFYDNYLGIQDTDNDGFNNIFGKSQIRFSSPDTSCGASHMLTEALKVNWEDTKTIRGYVQLQYNLDIQQAYYVDSSDGDHFGHGWASPHSPKIHFGWADTSSPVWDLGEANAGNWNTGMYDFPPVWHSNEWTDGETDLMPTNFISNNDFSLTTNYFNGENWQFDGQSGMINWMRYNQMTLRRVFIISDFLDTDLFAHVFGRNDNFDYRYTSLSSLSGEERRDWVYNQNKIRSNPISEPISAISRRPSLNKSVSKIKSKKLADRRLESSVKSKKINSPKKGKY